MRKINGIDYRKVIRKIKRSTPLINRIISVITVIILLICGAIVFLDKYYCKESICKQIINNILSVSGVEEFFINVISVVEQYSFRNVSIITIGIMIIIILTKITFKIVTFRKKVWIVYVINCVVNVVLIVSVAVYATSCIYISYVSKSFNYGEIGLGSVKYLQELDSISEDIRDRRLSATIEFSRIIEDVRKNKDYFYNLNNDELLQLSQRINNYINLKKGVLNRQEHYFRNNLNRSPQTLDLLINSDEKNNWVLLKPSKATYHMTGVSAEYNLKFISKDGHREAVYDKNGVLLTEKNDPINMGTYNYADPLESTTKHIEYDVEPYNEWGNVKGSESIPTAQLTINLINYYKSEEAQKRYEEIKDKMNN